MDLQYAKIQILQLGLLILGAYIGGILARKLKITEVVGQILGGVIVGPHIWTLVHRKLFTPAFLSDNPWLSEVNDFFLSKGFLGYVRIFESYSFITFLFLGVIAFSLGEELHHERLRKAGWKATIICLIQGIISFIFITVGLKILFPQVFSWMDALILGSIGIATAPAVTFILMDKFKIEGQLKSILANIVVMDDILEVIFFSVLLTIAQFQLAGNEYMNPAVLTYKILKELGLALLVAIGIFIVLKVAFKRRKLNPSIEKTEQLDTEDKTFLTSILFNTPTPSVEILLIVIGVVAIGVALAIHLEAPFLISAVVAGYLISNYHHSSFFNSLKIDSVMTILNLLFFGMIGVSINVDNFSRETLYFSLVYFALRLSGKLFGTWSGARITGMDPKIVATLPKLMLPQVGMAAVEIVLVAVVLKDGSGMLIFNTVVPALLLFELSGAYLSEKTLKKWKDYTVGESEAFTSVTLEQEIVTDLRELLAKRIFDFNMQEKEPILHKLVENAAAQGIILHVKAVYQAIMERESLGYVSNSYGIALPHIRLPYIQKPFLLCAILKEPIRWSKDDDYLVHTVFLILTPDLQPNLHIQILRAISLFIKEPDFTDKLRSMRT